MKKEFITAMKKRLEDERDRIVAELNKIGIKDPNASEEDWNARYVDVGSDTADNAYEVDQFATNKSIEHELEKSLRDINKALKRVEDGTYGVCKYCSEEVNEKRLEARPDASSCIACKKTFTRET